MPVRCDSGVREFIPGVKLYPSTDAATFALWSLSMFSAHGTLTIIEEIQIIDGGIRRNICGNSRRSGIDLSGQSFPFAVLPFPCRSRKAEFGVHDRNF